ncbi:NAD kinase 1 [Spiroplasma sp. JKS002669]|uniref:NAD(+)/NADH kinase n=1 Tax=Spiroplasma attinicola TaxID=2904537 RepID=UPI002022C26B|nr:MULTISPECIES: NAD(+)/NADH kinase [unclassified Spiroplasma]MCL6428575.1 NAD kinase 1 [Spiroplasma sp. JKS002669]MCL8209916.1 NAD kinase 1 [Spiroplasma sp. JKS002670]
MNNNYQFAIITSNYQEPKKFGLLLKEKLLQRKVKENNLSPDIVFIIGGDGTFLKAVNKYNQQLNKIKFVTFNQGNIGFYHNFSVDQIDQVLESLAKKDQNLIIKELDLLEVVINKKVIYGINEFRLVNLSQTLSCDVYINDQFLEFFRGSGLIIATKTGATGLMKTAGGAIIFAQTKLMQYQELFPVNNSSYRTINSPIIFDQEQSITLKIKSIEEDQKEAKERQSNTQIVVDTFNFYDKLIKEIKIKLSNQTLKVFSYKENIETLTNKINKYFIKS